MSVNVSGETEARLSAQARRLGISVDALLEQMISESTSRAGSERADAALELPVLHLGPMGEVHRRDIYRDVR